MGAPQHHHHATAFDVAETICLARTLRAWQPELLAYIEDRLTNGPTERNQPDHQRCQIRRFGFQRGVMVARSAQLSWVCRVSGASTRWGNYLHR